MQIEELISGASDGAAEIARPQSPEPEARRLKPVFGWRKMVPWVVTAAALAALANPALRYLRETPPPVPPETRTEINTPATDQPADFALSPDGRQIVFVASGDGASRLWLRSLATTTPQALAGTEGARMPFWSPDGRSIGFFAGSALKRLDLGGGAARALAPITGTATAAGGTWSADGVIVANFGGRIGPLQRVSATGGTTSAVTILGPQQQGHFAPSFLPDGHRFLFYVRGGPDTTGYAQWRFDWPRRFPGRTRGLRQTIGRH